MEMNSRPDPEGTWSCMVLNTLVKWEKYIGVCLRSSRNAQLQVAQVDDCLYVQLDTH